MLRYLPLIIAAVVAVPLTLYEGGISDRWNPVNTQAIRCAMLLDEIPLDIDGPDGLWKGFDRPLDEQIRATAGAEGYIQRTYVNQTTNEAVVVWFIVGHFRDVIRHTPNICYRAQGYKQIDEGIDRIHLGPPPAKPLTGPEQDDDGFFTTKFGGVDVLDDWVGVQRVYWGWWAPEQSDNGEAVDPATVRWVSPDVPRRAFQYPRALYKLYFTVGTDPEGTQDNPTALKFANLFIPIANKVIAKSSAVMDEEITPEMSAARKVEVDKKRAEIQAKADAEDAERKAAEAGNKSKSKK